MSERICLPGMPAFDLATDHRFAHRHWASAPPGFSDCAESNSVACRSLIHFYRLYRMTGFSPRSYRPHPQERLSPIDRYFRQPQKDRYAANERRFGHSGTDSHAAHLQQPELSCGDRPVLPGRGALLSGKRLPSRSRPRRGTFRPLRMLPRRSLRIVPRPALLASRRSSVRFVSLPHLQQTNLLGDKIGGTRRARELRQRVPCARCTGPVATVQCSATRLHPSTRSRLHSLERGATFSAPVKLANKNAPSTRRFASYPERSPCRLSFVKTQRLGPY